MARQRPPSLRIDVGDNSAVPARLRNILEAHPETASSSPGSLRSAFAFVTDLRARCRRVKSDTDTALREMLQLPQLRYAVGDDVVPTDELRAHEREALVALHGLCTSFIEHTDLGTAAAAQSTLASILCVLLPLSTYCIAWCVLFPRILKFAEHSRALYAKVTKSKKA